MTKKLLSRIIVEKIDNSFKSNTGRIRGKHREDSRQIYPLFQYIQILLIFHQNVTFASIHLIYIKLNSDVKYL